MQILEYNNVNPVGVLHLNMLALDFSLTPEHAAHILRTDPRPFPCLAVYAVENNVVLGQVGIFRLPMVSTEGREDVGGVWAVATHPQHAARGIASRLLDEAHERIRQAGLRFSTLVTNRYHGAYRLFHRHGYEDMGVWGTAFAPWDTAHLPTRLHAQRPGDGGFGQIDRVFEHLAPDYLGFAWRHTPFARMREEVSLDDVWVLYQNDQPIGYAITQVDKDMLKISTLLLQDGVDATEAVAAVIAELKTPFVQVKTNRPNETTSLGRAGYQVAHPDRDAFMLKSLVPGVTVDDASRLFGIGTDRFLISWLDTT